MRPKPLLFAIMRWVFFLASLAYLVAFARQTVSGQDFRSFITAKVTGHVAVAILLFASTTVFSVIGWRALLKELGHPVSAKSAAAVFCYTQMGKYLPGNIGHHVGRAALAKTRLDVPARISAVSILQEASLVSLAAVFVGLAGYSLPLRGVLLHLPVHFPTWALLAALVASTVLGVTLTNWARTRGFSSSYKMLEFVLLITPTWNAMRWTIPSYICIPLLNGLALLVIAEPSLGLSASNFLALTTAYALSWLAGFLLPGAPGGLGVRESAFTLLLAGTYQPETILLTITLARVATVGADALLFLIGSGLLGRQGRQPHANQSEY